MLRPEKIFVNILILVFCVDSLYTQILPPSNLLSLEVQKRISQAPQDPTQPYRLLKPTKADASRKLQTVRDAQFLSLDKETLAEIMHERKSMIEVQLPYHEKMIRIKLFPFDPKADEFSVSSPSGILEHEDMIHFRGIIAGDHQSVVALSLGRDEVTGIISSADMGNLILAQLPTDPRFHILYEETNLKAESKFICDAILPPGYQIKEIRSSSSRSNQSPACVTVFFETSFNVLQKFDGNLDKTINYITGLFNQVSAIYANEEITLLLSDLYIWTIPDPYNHDNTAAALESFTNAPLKGYANLRYLLDMSDSSSGGRAYVDVLCDKTFNVGYCNIVATYETVPTYSWSVNILAHEVGHGLGSFHTQDCVWGEGKCAAIDGCADPNPEVGCGSCSPAPIPDRGTIMSYCHLQKGIDFSLGLGMEPGALMRSRVAGAECLSNCDAEIRLICSISIEDIEVTAARCDKSNGIVKVLISGGSGSESFDIGYGPQSEHVFTNLAPGEYRIIVKDGIACTRTADVVVPSESNAPDLEAVVTNASCNGKDGSIEIIPLGGHAPYHYYVQEQETKDSIIPGLEPGEYLIGLVDKEGCTAAKKLTIFEEMSPLIDIKTEPTQCGQANGKMLLTGIGGTLPYFFEIQSSTHYDSLVINQTSTIIDQMDAGIYQIMVQDAQGCLDSMEVSIDSSSNIGLQVFSNPASCDAANGEIEIVASGGNQPYRYFLDENEMEGPKSDRLSSGSYVVKVIDSEECQNSALVQIKNDPSFVAPKLPDQLVLCDGDEVVLNSGLSPLTKVTWLHNGDQMDDTTTSILITKAGRYQALVKYGESCTLSDQTQVILQEKPTVSLEPTIEICEGSDFHFSKPFPGYHYVWSNGTTGVQTQFIESGEYTLEVFSEHGCKQTIPIMVNIIPQINLRVANPEMILCEGEEIHFHAAGVSSYTWTTDVPGQEETIGTGSFIKPDHSTKYQVIGRNECFADTLAISVSFHDFIRQLPGDTNALKGTSLFFSIPEGEDIRWQSTHPMDCGTCRQTRITVMGDGQLFVTYTDANGCLRTETTHISTMALTEITPEIITEITPDGDGKNDHLYIHQLERYSGATVEVFANSGARVFISSDYKNDWPPNSGIDLTSGEYRYTINIKSGTEVVKLAGKLDIIR